MLMEASISVQSVNQLLSAHVYICIILSLTGSFFLLMTLHSKSLYENSLDDSHTCLLLYVSLLKLKETNILLLPKGFTMRIILNFYFCL